MLKLNNENCLTKFIMVVLVVAAVAAAVVVGTVVAVFHIVLKLDQFLQQSGTHMLHYRSL